MNTKRLLSTILLLLLCWHSPLFSQIADADYAPVIRTIMSYNIRNATNDYGAPDYGNVATTILRHQPEVVALQELDSITQRSKHRDVLREVALLTQYFPIYGPAIDYDGGKYGLGLLCKHRPLSVNQIPLPGREEARTLLIAEFDDFVMACTHLSLTEEDRMASLSLIKAEAERHHKPFLLAGDLNDTPKSDFIRLMTKDFTILSPTNKGTYPATSPKKCIDYIACYKPTGSSIVLRGNKVLEHSGVSDHRPIIASIQKKTPTEQMLYGKPYLQNPTPNSINVMFQSLTRVHAWVEYGTDTLQLQRSQMEYGGQAVCHKMEHRVPLTDLQPGQKYYYRICAREILHYAAYNKVIGDTLTTSFYSFTLPSRDTEDFTAIILNDLHQNHTTINSLAKIVNEIPHDFIIFNGDCLTEPATRSEAMRMVHNITEPFNIAETPAYFVRGNHEIRNAYSAGLADLLVHPEDPNTYGAFCWGDTRFVILDCGEDKPDEHPVYYGMNDFTAFREAQKEFLLKEIRSRAFRRANRRILVSHIPVWGSDDKYQPCTELWSPVLEHAHFDLALAGHTHKRAFHSTGKANNPFPICIGDGPKESEAVILVLRKQGKDLTLKMLNSKGKELDSWEL